MCAATAPPFRSSSAVAKLSLGFRRYRNQRRRTGALGVAVEGCSRRLAVVVVALSTVLCAVATTETPQQAFIKRWEGQPVVVQQTLYTLVYNERGKLGNTRSGKRDGLTVVTPSAGTYLQFDGRQGRDAVVERQPQKVVEAVGVAYQPDSLDIRSYRKVEPVLMMRHDPGAELVVGSVRLERDTVRLSFAQGPAQTADEDPVTALTVKWPIPFSKSFTERELVENLIRQFVDVAR